MSIPVANVANTNSFYYWQTVTNQLAGVMTTAVITTTANGSSAQTAGNAALGGTMFANGFVSSVISANVTMYVGNSTVNVSINTTSLSLSNSSASVTMVRPTAAQMASGLHWLNANGNWAIYTQNTTVIGTVNTVGTGLALIDQWDIGQYRSADYQINVNDNVANAHMVTRIAVMHDTANTFATEYAVLYSNGIMGAFTHGVFGSNVFLQFTPISANTQVRFVRVAT